MAEDPLALSEDDMVISLRRGDLNELCTAVAHMASAVEDVFNVLDRIVSGGVTEDPPGEPEEPPIEEPPVEPEEPPVEPDPTPPTTPTPPTVPSTGSVDVVVQPGESVEAAIKANPGKVIGLAGGLHPAITIRNLDGEEAYVVPAVASDIPLVRNAIRVENATNLMFSGLAITHIAEGTAYDKNSYWLNCYNVHGRGLHVTGAAEDYGFFIQGGGNTGLRDCVIEGFDTPVMMWGANPSLPVYLRDTEIRGSFKDGINTLGNCDVFRCFIHSMRPSTGKHPDLIQIHKGSKQAGVPKDITISCTIGWQGAQTTQGIWAGQDNNPVAYEGLVTDTNLISTGHVHGHKFAGCLRSSIRRTLLMRDTDNPTSGVKTGPAALAGGGAAISECIVPARHDAQSIPGQITVEDRPGFTEAGGEPRARACWEAVKAAGTMDAAWAAMLSA